MRSYKCLNTAQYTEGGYTLLPIRDEDKYEIMSWRNAQLEILRQTSPLTVEHQEKYFETTIASLFEKNQPEQLLWSFLEDGKLIGYGGLVHIDWINKSGEISFLTETSRSRSREQLISDWTKYLEILKRIAKDDLHFNCIYTYAYDIRPDLYIALEKSGFNETRRIKDFIEINGSIKDVVIHTWYCKELQMRFAKLSDADLYFEWANDILVRENSFNQSSISYNEHINWFTKKVAADDCFFYLFTNNKNIPVGQVRIEKKADEVVIGISTDVHFRGKGFGSEMLRMATDNYLQQFPQDSIHAYIKVENVASVSAFEKAGFKNRSDIDVNGAKSYRLSKSQA